jgi:signal transduction histidine kinase
MRTVLLIVSVGVEYPALLSTVDWVGFVGFILRLKAQVFSSKIYKSLLQPYLNTLVVKSAARVRDGSGTCGFLPTRDMCWSSSVLENVSWLAVGSIVAGAISLGFIQFLWEYREKPGGRFFIATIACEALWSFAYGAALLVFDPTLRPLFEIPIWFAINFIGVFFLAFALEYTGRGSLLRSRWMAGVVGIQTVHTLIVVTNPMHHIAWSDYAIDPVYGAATVSYAHQPWLFVNATGFIFLIGAASFLLVDTVISYGKLYRLQAAAIAVSPIFPGLPFLLWLIQVGNTPPLNLTPLVFPIHLAFDMYAFFARNMFEMVPAARRVADRAAVEDLGSPVVIVDDGGKLIRLNTAAGDVLDVDTDAALGDPLERYLGDVDPDADGQTVSLRTGGRNRQFAVSTSSLYDSSAVLVGNTIVLQDITDEREREQRLAVLNRVLRHNLRNDLNVVEGFIDIAREQVDDEEVQNHLDTAEENTRNVIDLGEKARDIERVVGSEDREPSPVSLRAELDRMRSDLLSDHPEASIDLDVSPDLTLYADELLIDRVFRNLLTNAIEHGGGEVTISAREEDGGDSSMVVAVVADEGPGVPDHELSVLDANVETALEHGSGLGLWLVKWGIGTLGGTIEFDTDDGTTATLHIPSGDAAPE